MIMSVDRELPMSPFGKFLGIKIDEYSEGRSKYNFYWRIDPFRSGAGYQPKNHRVK